MSTRSRREIRTPSNYQEESLGEFHEESQKRKAPKAEAMPVRKTPLTADGKPGSLSWILSSEKSPLCKVDLSKILNADTWECLSPQDREELSVLLPPTVYPFFETSLPSYHPSTRRDTMHITDDIIPAMELDGIEADPSSFLNCPHFEAAQITFQDHLYSGWYGKKHSEDIDKYRTGVTEGSRHAPWKDDLWEEEQRRDEETEMANQTSGSSRPRNGLVSMASHGLIREGDIIGYRRSFPDLSITIEKDALLLNTGSGGITVVAPAHLESHLPLGMLLGNAKPPAETMLQQMTIQTLEQLEVAILDMDGQIPHERRAGGNSWKRFTLWKWNGELERELEVYGGRDVGPRGPREKRGTFFYLRGAYLPQSTI